MKKEITKEDLKKANNIEKCKIIKAIIKRTSNIYKRLIDVIKERKLLSIESVMKVYE